MDDRLILPMSSRNFVLPGEEIDVSARPTYIMIPDEICFDPRSGVIRRAYFGTPGREIDLVLTRNVVPTKGLCTTIDFRHSIIDEFSCRPPEFSCSRETGRRPDRAERSLPRTRERAGTMPEHRTYSRQPWA